MPHGFTILIVEDDEALGGFYRSTLTSAGFDVVNVRDGMDALRYLDQRVPDLVVLDLSLPLLDGRAVQQEIRANAETQSIPIVVVTGSTEPLEDLDDECILRKPVDPDELVATVRSCLHPSHLNRR